MRKFFFFSLFYMSIAICTAALFRDDVSGLAGQTLLSLLDQLRYVADYAPILLIALIASAFFKRKQSGPEFLRQLSFAAFGSLIFMVSFTALKTSIPYIVPYYADPFFADLDRVMHGGVDPWILSHQFSDWIPPWSVLTIYLTMWIPLAIFFPIILVFVDDNEERQNRFLLLYCFSWIGLGNIIALAGSSVGPIYYDALLGTESFLGLRDALARSGLADSPMGYIQGLLWASYKYNEQHVGTGISAFPSVHVGTAMMLCLYLAERSMRLIPIGIAFLAAILFLSVYIGWHYAIDGYFSILVVWLAWYLIKRKRTGNAVSASPKS